MSNALLPSASTNKPQFFLVRLRRWEIALQMGEICDHCIQQVIITKLKITLMLFVTHLRLISLLL